MSNMVWASAAPMNGSRPLRLINTLHDEGKERPYDRGAAFQTRVEAGEPVSADEFPKEMWGMEVAPRYKEMPDFFWGFTNWVMSQAAVSLLI